MRNYTVDKDALRARVKARGYRSVERLASDVGWSHGHLQRIMRGVRQPSRKLYLRLIDVDVLDCRDGDFLIPNRDEDAR
ncbi:helix-turn-helix domain-containing protein [Allonocardiopsis opalescens]|uniref:HTH cro/C1-type domain-containing protein n=1 Tax=Allonocardiopsis opalescens TaxID=1144618 RepID=A0A2T0PP73_9ACTN|nr:helix-turn-helix transcriptional regulator [Allonocardiopsis opalescens]PRX90700.1 hypothetical protein CLV72_11838 [Allonocardiopsis opalescens]